MARIVKRIVQTITTVTWSIPWKEKPVERQINQEGVTLGMLFIVFISLAQALAACGTASPAAEPATAPPEAPTATAIPEAVDPAEVVQGFWIAMQTGDVEAAMALVASDARCRGSCYFTGEQSFRAYLQGMKNAGTTTEISDVKVEGEIVSYSYKVYRNGFVVEDNAAGESMQVQDGKIIFWNNLHN